MLLYNVCNERTLPWLHSAVCYARNAVVCMVATTLLACSHTPVCALNASRGTDSDVPEIVPAHSHRKQNNAVTPSGLARVRRMKALASQAAMLVQLIEIPLAGLLVALRNSQSISHTSALRS